MSDTGCHGLDSTVFGRNRRVARLLSVVGRLGSRMDLGGCPGRSGTAFSSLGACDGLRVSGQQFDALEAVRLRCGELTMPDVPVARFSLPSLAARSGSHVQSAAAQVNRSSHLRRSRDHGIAPICPSGGPGGGVRFVGAKRPLVVTYSN